MAAQGGGHASQTGKVVLRKNPVLYRRERDVPLEHSSRPLRKPEVLAPAGGWEQLRAAVENGADAVYFGVSDFNARARAENFSLESLPEILSYLHQRGMKGYLVLNVLLFDEELLSLANVAQAARRAGVDAVIVQDIGAVELIKAVAPGLSIHGSTQMTVTSADGMEYARHQGVERVVVGRELSVADIADIARHTDLEIVRSWRSLCLVLRAVFLIGGLGWSIGKPGPMCSGLSATLWTDCRRRAEAVCG